MSKFFHGIIATPSYKKQCTKMLFNLISVNYQQGQEAYLLFSGAYNNYFPNEIDLDRYLITISPDAFTVAIANGKSFIMINTQTKEKSNVLQDVHGGNVYLSFFTSLNLLA